jgi:hypothetical protein
MQRREEWKNPGFSNVFGNELVTENNGEANESFTVPAPA